MKEWGHAHHLVLLARACFVRIFPAYLEKREAVNSPIITLLNHLTPTVRPQVNETNLKYHDVIQMKAIQLVYCLLCCTL